MNTSGDDRIFTVAAFAIILNEKNEVFHIHRRDVDLWEIPGGGVEHGETPAEAIVREVKEETGIIVEVSRLAGVYTRQPEHAIVFSFVCTIVGGEFQMTDEADVCAWYAVGSLPTNVSPIKKQRIHDALEHTDTVFSLQEGSNFKDILLKM